MWDRNYDRRPAPKTYTEQGIALGNFAIDQGAAGVVYTIPEALIPEGAETEAELTQRYFTHAQPPRQFTAIQTDLLPQMLVSLVDGVPVVEPL